MMLRHLLAMIRLMKEICIFECTVAPRTAKRVACRAKFAGVRLPSYHEIVARGV